MSEIRVLLVDDEHRKAQRISVFLTGLHLDIRFVHIPNAGAAREELCRAHFDILLIDVNLPEASDREPASEGGFEFYDLWLMDHESVSPSEILFVTEREDLINEARAKADTRGIHLCSISASEDSWKRYLSAVCKRISKRVSSEKDTNVDVALVTAMRQPELEAVLRLPFNWHRERFEGDPTSYHFGTAQIGGSNIKVVAASAMKKGLSASAALTSKLISRTKPRVVFMVGICAGVRKKTGIGDVVIASPTWDWGSGKHVEGTDGSVVFRSGALQSASKPELIEIINDVAEDASTIRTLRANWEGKVPEGELAVRTGPMASGASVLANVRVVNDVIIPQNRDVIAVEMEGYGVMAAAEAFNVPSIVIKSVCDFADAEKSDGWQDYASYTSAEFMRLVLPRVLKVL